MFRHHVWSCKMKGRKGWAGTSNRVPVCFWCTPSALPGSMWGADENRTFYNVLSFLLDSVEKAGEACVEHNWSQGSPFSTWSREFCDNESLKFKITEEEVSAPFGEKNRHCWFCNVDARFSMQRFRHSFRATNRTVPLLDIAREEASGIRFYLRE